MIDWDARRVAELGGARLQREPARGARGPSGVSIDSRTTAPGDLFVGLAGSRSDGGIHAGQALGAGAWGVLVAPKHCAAALAAGGEGAVLVHPRPLAGLQALAGAWRRELGEAGASVVAITGSAGKTSTKDILAALLSQRLRTSASAANLNTEIGVPLSILAAPPACEALVLELAMRGTGQIAELTAVSRPDVGVIVNVGPAHLELLGSLEAIAEAKAELIAGLAPGATAVVPAGEPLLQRHLRGDVRTITFGSGGEVSLRERRDDGAVVIAAAGEEIELRPSFSQRHNLDNLLAAVAAAVALGQTPSGPLEVRFSEMRGQQLALRNGVTVIDDCYNANPMSMRAAIDDLAETAPGRRVAVLGDMLELGAQGPALHREVGRHAGERGVQLLVTVGPLAAEMGASFDGETHAARDAAQAAGLLASLLRPGDTVLVKGSRGVGLERVIASLPGAPEGPAAGRAGGEGRQSGEGPAITSGAGAGRR